MKPLFGPTHLAPVAGNEIMPCCGKRPDEVSSRHRMTTDQAKVTCGIDVPALMEKVERIYAVEIRPEDVVILHVESDTTPEECEVIANGWWQSTHLDNQVVVFAGELRIEVQRPI